MTPLQQAVRRAIRPNFGATIAPSEPIAPQRIINKRVFKMGAGITSPNAARQQQAMKDADMRLVKRIAALLEFHHPGHFFRVTVDHDMRLVRIELPPLLETPYSFNIPISVLSCDPGLKTVRDAAGSILERFGLPRSTWSDDQYRAAVRAQPVGGNRRRGYKVPE